MPTLKEVGKLSSASGASLLSTSPMWDQDIEKIKPVQIHAFIQRMKMEGKRDQAETAVEIAMSETMKAVASGQIAPPEYLYYERRVISRLTIGELRRGLAHMGQPYASAALFALEQQLSSREVATLTWKTLNAKYDQRTFSPLVAECLKASPQNLRFQYVFWHLQDGKPIALHNLEAVTFDAFGLTWGELEDGYKNLIMIDEEADVKSLDCFFQR